MGKDGGEARRGMTDEILELEMDIPEKWVLLLEEEIQGEELENTVRIEYETDRSRACTSLVAGNILCVYCLVGRELRDRRWELNSSIIVGFILFCF